MTTRFASDRTDRLFNVSAGAAIAGGVVLIAGWVVAPTQIAIAYLVAYTAAVAVLVGALLLIMVAHLSGAVWFVLLRRNVESVVSALPALAVLTTPLLVAPHAFWPPSVATSRAVTYLHPAFFATRTVAYWAVWLVLGETLCRTSRRQDDSADEATSRRFRIVSAAGIPAAGLALSFASFDWMMSLTPGWTSSVYGAYYFAGASVSALGLVAVLAARRRHWAPTTEHFQALGRLTLAFLLFWAYLWYAQFFIIWIADIPSETIWYVARFGDGWGVLGRTIVVTAFVIPFLVLMFRAARGSALVMSGLGVWLLIVHYLDVYWLLVPSARPAWSPSDLLWDLGALCLVAGSATAVALWRQATVPSAATSDPLFQLSVRYEAH